MFPCLRAPTRNEPIGEWLRWSEVDDDDDEAVRHATVLSLGREATSPCPGGSRNRFSTTARWEPVRYTASDGQPGCGIRIADSAMAIRLLSCAIEQVADWHSNLFVETHVAAFVAVAEQYSQSPARFSVECDNIVSRWLGNAREFQVEISWHRDSAANAERLRATMQSRPLVEFASVALALVLVRRVWPLGRLDVTDYGDRADYRSRRRKIVLEVSGTEVAGELGRRHREKVAQARDNPFGWDACVVVCGFLARGHRVRFSRHSLEETEHVEG